jgi:putative copper export protein
MAASAIWSPDRSVAPPDTLWRGSRLPDPGDALDALWGADTDVIDLTGGPGPVTGRRGDPSTTHHLRRARTRQHPRPVTPATVAPATGSRLAGAARALLAALARGVGALMALGVAWVVLVTLRHEQRVAYSDAIAAELDAAVIETLTTDHVLSVATWVGYVASTVLLGGLVFERFVARRQVRLRLGTTVVVGLLAAGAALPLRAAEVSGQGLTALTDPEVFRLVATSAFGGALVLRAAGLLVLGATLGSRAGAGRMRGFARIVGGAIVVASYLLIGHPQANDPTVLEVGALTVHLLAVATWLGGVVVLANELRPRPAGGGRRLSNDAVARFSRMAEAMVVLVLGSGLVLAEGQNALSTAPWRTGYGLALTVKLCFVGVVLLIGGYNKLRVVPAIAERDCAAARRHLRSTCIVESMVISMGVLLMTAAMTSGGF